MLAGPIVFGLVLFALSTAAGMAGVVKIITIYEAKHELRHGSAGFIRSVTGWSLVGFWVLAVWYFGTILGDWIKTDDLSGAVDRSLVRLYVLIEIAIAMADSD